MLLILAAAAHEPVHGMTISTPTAGREWGTSMMDGTLDQMPALGVGWISIHPYARIHADGTVVSRLDRAEPTAEIRRPIEQAHARGLKVMIKPHLAYWGSPFSWRGDIRFDGAAEERFFTSYATWMADVAAIAHDADAIVVGTELEGTTHAEAEWREIIARVRKQTPAKLTYGANWDRVGDVPFWDALDAIGVQAYYPLDLSPDPGVDALRAGWERVFVGLRRLSTATGKPIVFTELGYDASDDAASKPWATGGRATENNRALQERALGVALAAIEAEPSVTGAFLWKWFPGEVQHGDFRMSEPRLQAVIREHWAMPTGVSTDAESVEPLRAPSQ